MGLCLLNCENQFHFVKMWENFALLYLFPNVLELTKMVGMTKPFRLLPKFCGWCCLSLPWSYVHVYITKPTQNQRFAGNFQQMIYGYLDIFLVSPQKRFVGTANASNEHHNIFFCGEIRKISIGFG